MDLKKEFKFLKFRLFRRRFMVNLSKIEIDLTTDCTLACKNCDRSISQAPSKEYISLEQIKKFYNESLELNWNWEKISLLGGEPTLHPQFFEILDILYQYKTKKTDCIIEVVSNGYGSQVKDIINQIPPWVKIINTEKESSDSNFLRVNVAPIDFKKFRKNDFSSGCIITNSVGMGLSRYGYYPCGAGAAHDRVFGFDIGLKSLKEVNQTTMDKIKSTLCKYCGHYRFKFLDPNNAKLFTKNQEYSATWDKQVKEYRTKKPTLRLY